MVSPSSESKILVSDSFLTKLSILSLNNPTKGVDTEKPSCTFILSNSCVIFQPLVVFCYSIIYTLIHFQMLALSVNLSHHY